MKKDRRDPSDSPVEGRGEHKKNWKEYTATVEDIQNFLMDRIYLRHNVVTGRVESKDPSQPPLFRGGDESPSPSPKQGRTGGVCWVPLSDRIVNSLWSELSAT